MISAAIEGKLNEVEFEQHPIFGLQMPKECPQVPAEVLCPRDTWQDQEAYDKKANLLASYFKDNFEKFDDYANDEILKGGPIV